MSKTSLKTTVEWNQVNWRKLERRVFKLQNRIYRAAQRGDVKALRRLQKTLMKSWSAKAIAVRRVTQDNQGKKTAGVDGVKSLTPRQRINLVGKLRLNNKVNPTRRVWIPKPGTDEKRPLLLPTMNDTALQALVKMVLEPEWEARFEPNSYGFRPGRSCQDAIEAIYLCIHGKAKYVLDADISKCFDKINHEALLRKLNTFPTIRRQVKAWLKAGVMDGQQLFPTNEGTPQGGVISPLLANIALHGMENRIKQFAETLPTQRNVGKKQNRNALSLIRYADDFVVLHEDVNVIQRCKTIIANWLRDMGLELKPSKTRIAHTLNTHGQEKPGFDFLGFTIRQFPAGRHKSGLKTNGEKLGFKTIITPSEKAIREHYKQISEVIDAHKTAPQAALINHLNPLIRGWANYYSKVSSKEIFTEMNHLVYRKLRAWAKYRHPNKSWNWIADKYWQSIGGDNWVFATRQDGTNPLRLIKHGKFQIERHTKVRGEMSPYDGNLVYWSQRMGRNPEMPERVAILLKKQKGMCTHCGLYFRENDVMEIDHKIPKSKGGRDTHNNRQLLHRHCHDVKTASDGSLGNQSGCNSAEPKSSKHLNKVNGIWTKAVSMTSDQFAEEPDEVKVSRPVLETSGIREGFA